MPRKSYPFPNGSGDYATIASRKMQQKAARAKAMTAALEKHTQYLYLAHHALERGSEREARNFTAFANAALHMHPELAAILTA